MQDFTDVLSREAKWQVHSSILESHGLLLGVKWAFTSWWTQKPFLQQEQKDALLLVHCGGHFEPWQPISWQPMSILRLVYVPSESTPADAESRGKRRTLFKPRTLGNPLHASSFVVFLSASSCSTVTAHRLRCRSAHRLYLRGVTTVASFEVGSHPSAWKQRTSSPSLRRWSWVWHRLDEDFTCWCSYFLLFKYVAGSGRLRQSGLLGFALLTACSCSNCSASQELVGKAVLARCPLTAVTSRCTYMLVMRVI